MANPFSSLSRTQVIIALAGFTGITGYLAYKHHQSTGSWNPFSAGSSSATTSSTVIDPVTGLPTSQDNAIDPVTGLAYLAEAEQYGSVAAAEADVSQFGGTVGTGSGVGVSPATYPVANSPNGTQTGSPYTSNAAWAQAAQAGLTDVGYDALTVADALGAYITQQPLTSAQAAIVNTAIAEYGPPPVGPLQVILAPPSPPGAGMVTVPSVTGFTVAGAESAIKAAGLAVGTVSAGSGTVTGQSPAAGTSVTKGSKVNLTVGGSSGGGKAPGAIAGLSITGHAGYADFGWDAISGAQHYDLAISGKEARNLTETGNHAEHVTLKAGRYTAKVRAVNSAGSGPWASRGFTVK